MNSLKEELSSGSWTTERVRKLITERFSVEYSSRQVTRILKRFGMKHGKPYPHDYRRPADAEERLKKMTEKILNDEVICFFDETSPQTTANTVRLWSFLKPSITRDTRKYKDNTFGFYAIRGNSAMNFPEHSRKDDVVAFLEKIRIANPNGRILIILDNFRSHHATVVARKAIELPIDLMFLPPYSPYLNQIEFIWRV